VRFSAVGPAIVMPMLIGYKKARELLYFGDQIDAKTALDLGMVNRIVGVLHSPGRTAFTRMCRLSRMRVARQDAQTASRDRRWIAPWSSVALAGNSPVSMR
jgi:enoyl-CoA hydratase/carnithine racemase